MKTKTMLGELDELLVEMGRYPSKEELREDALRALLRAKPELRRDAAIELYKKEKVSLWRAAEIAGMILEEFKALLKERGVEISVPDVPPDEMEKEVERILGAQ